MKFQCLTQSPAQTKKAGEILAREILRISPKKKAFVLGLEGDLGGGKTTFLQGFAKELGIKEKILSPTFIILKKFSIFNCNPTGSPRWVQQFSNFYHIDCYRLQKPKEILTLGFKEIASDSKNIVAVEWADKIQKIMPKDTLWIEFKFVNKKTRKIVLK